MSLFVCLLLLNINALSHCTLQYIYTHYNILSTTIKKDNILIFHFQFISFFFSSLLLRINFSFLCLWKWNFCTFILRFTLIHLFCFLFIQFDYFSLFLSIYLLNYLIHFIIWIEDCINNYWVWCLWSIYWLLLTHHIPDTIKFTSFISLSKVTNFNLIIVMIVYHFVYIELYWYKKKLKFVYILKWSNCCVCLFIYLCFLSVIYIFIYVEMSTISCIKINLYIYNQLSFFFYDHYSLWCEPFLALCLLHAQFFNLKFFFLTVMLSIFVKLTNIYSIGNLYNLNKILLFDKLIGGKCKFFYF